MPKPEPLEELQRLLEEETIVVYPQAPGLLTVIALGRAHDVATVHLLLDYLERWLDTQEVPHG